MQLTQQQLLPVSQAVAWEALNDIPLLQQCIPGCESLTADSADQYAVVMTAAVGPVRAKFKGKLKIEDRTPPASYRLKFEGQGGAAGHGRGHADVHIEAVGPTSTLLHYTAHASVGGKLAQIGSRLVDMAAQKMATDFFAKFTDALRERHPAPVEAVSQPVSFVERPSLWHRVRDWVRQLFR